MYTTRRLWPYFQNNQIIVRIDCPIEKNISKPELAGRMVAWSVELSEFGIRYELRRAIRAQSLANFIIQLSTTTSEQEAWVLYVDGSSNKKGSRAKIVLERPKDFQLEMALKFEFKTSNNQAKYETLIARLILVRDMGAQNVICKSDSQLTMRHIKCEYEI
ncbi:uncharacterized protein [Phaseolus vulgaris]|uniref:uncharacterized protein n=1 Tax=Phaseolus vulgaris TaxID=3885 RepID=UPI0035CABC15